MGQTTVTQKDGLVSVEERGTFQTTCTYQNSSFDALFWYQQRRGQAPQQILYQARDGRTESSRFTTLLNTIGKSSVLRLEEVQVSETAFYLCAVQ
ncbi:TVA12 protein, partial [Crypturellus soui]|nr:TVA12 protein [Crypturellus soui]